MSKTNYLLIAALLPALSMGAQAGPLTMSKSVSPAELSAAATF